MKFEDSGEEGVVEKFEDNSHLQLVDAVFVQLLADRLSSLETYLPVFSRRTACLRNIIKL